jgi:hypothetical protein
MGQLFSDAYNADPNVSVGVSRRLPNISISATSTPDQFSDAIQRLEARCVRLSQLKANAEALKTEEEEDEEPATSKRQTLVNELVGSIKSIEADIVSNVRFCSLARLNHFLFSYLPFVYLDRSFRLC